MLMDIEQELVTLRRMTAGQLRQRYDQLFGEVSRSSHKAYLIRKIAWRLQAQAEGDLSLRARRRAAAYRARGERQFEPGKSRCWAIFERETVEFWTRCSPLLRTHRPTPEKGMLTASSPCFDR
jgi:hypothetical protein